MKMGRQRIRVAYDLKVGLRTDGQTGLHVAWCPALNLYAQGTSQDEARESIHSAISMYLVTCYERGILDRQLRLRGAVKAVSAEPSDESDDSDFVEVALEGYPTTLDVQIPINLLVADSKIESVGAGRESWTQQI